MASTGTPSPVTPGLQTRLFPLATHTRYRHIYFSLRFPVSGQPRWTAARSYTGSTIGSIAVGEPWPTWVFEPATDVLLTSGQLTDLLLFIRQITL